MFSLLESTPNKALHLIPARPDELGPELRETVEDVYCALAVFRVRNTEPDGAANGSLPFRSE